MVGLSGFVSRTVVWSVGRSVWSPLSGQSVGLLRLVGRSVVLPVNRSVGSLVGWSVRLVGRSVGCVWSVGSGLSDRSVALLRLVRWFWSVGWVGWLSGQSVGLSGRLVDRSVGCLVDRSAVWAVGRFVWSVPPAGRLSVGRCWPGSGGSRILSISQHPRADA